jgi:ribosome-binding factor A
MTWNRRRRTEALLKERVAMVLVESLSDPRLGFTTVTRVELSPDKKFANVYYTVLGEPAQVRMTARALADAAPHIQEVIGPGLHMRSVPQLRFHFDESIERERHMRNVLQDLSDDRQSTEEQSLADAEDGTEEGAETPSDDNRDDGEDDPAIG